MGNTSLDLWAKSLDFEKNLAPSFNLYYFLGKLTLGQNKSGIKLKSRKQEFCCGMLSTLHFIHQLWNKIHFSPVREDAEWEQISSHLSLTHGTEQDTFFTNLIPYSVMKQLQDKQLFWGIDGDALHHWFVEFLGIVLHKSTNLHFIIFRPIMKTLFLMYWTHLWQLNYQTYRLTRTSTLDISAKYWIRFITTLFFLVSVNVFNILNFYNLCIGTIVLVRIGKDCGSGE